MGYLHPVSVRMMGSQCSLPGHSRENHWPHLQNIPGSFIRPQHPLRSGTALDARERQGGGTDVEMRLEGEEEEQMGGFNYREHWREMGHGKGGGRNRG